MIYPFNGVKEKYSPLEIIAFLNLKENNYPLKRI